MNSPGFSATVRQPMSHFTFRSLAGSDITPEEWLRTWANQYPVRKYDPEHDRLIAIGELSAADFVGIGRWKDAASSDGKWKPNVASVAYDIWKQAASERPICPDGSGGVDRI